MVWYGREHDHQQGRGAGARKVEAEGPSSFEEEESSRTVDVDVPAAAVVDPGGGPRQGVDPRLYFWRRELSSASSLLDRDEDLDAGEGQLEFDSALFDFAKGLHRLRWTWRFCV